MHCRLGPQHDYSSLIENGAYLKFNFIFEVGDAALQNAKAFSELDRTAKLELGRYCLHGRNKIECYRGHPR